MKTFNKKTKQKYIDRAIKHREADEVIQGSYWGNGKGCCVGCLSHVDVGSHGALEDQTGIPIWLSELADSIHEGLPDGEFRGWPEQFVSAIPTNTTHRVLEAKVKARFMVVVLKAALENFDHGEFPSVKSASDDAAAWDAAYTADAAARSAGAAAARSAEASDDDAAWDAWDAADAARHAAWVYFRDELIRILEEV